MSLPQDYMLEIGAVCLHDGDIPVVPTPTASRAPISADPGAGAGYPLAVGRPVGQNIILGVIGQPGDVAAIGIHHVDILALVEDDALFGSRQLDMGKSGQEECS